MPSDAHIRRLVRELVLPEDADLVIQKPKYWIPEFCRLYFRRCDELISEIPADGLAAAEVCPELVYLTETVTRQPQHRLRLRALAVLGSAHRATDDLDRADGVYKAAFALLEKSSSISQTDVANLLFRVAVLRSCQDQYQEAVHLASRSVDIYRRALDHVRRRHLGETLTVRGYIHHMNGRLELAMKDWGEAVACTDVKLTPRIFYAVAHNIALGMMQSVVPPRDLSVIEKHVTQASRYFSGKPLSVPKLKILWLRAMIMMRFGSTRRGEATYRKVMSGFLRLGNVVDMALVGVALGRHFYRERRFEELKSLAIEIDDACDLECKNSAIRNAVSIWKEAVIAETVSAEAFSATWNVLERDSFARAARLNADGLALKVTSIQEARS